MSKGLIAQMKAALEKKHAAQHPDTKTEEVDGKKAKGRAPAVINKPQKRVTGRGR